MACLCVLPGLVLSGISIGMKIAEFLISVFAVSLCLDFMLPAYACSRIEQQYSYFDHHCSSHCHYHLCQPGLIRRRTDLWREPHCALTHWGQMGRHRFLCLGTEENCLLVGAALGRICPIIRVHFLLLLFPSLILKGLPAGSHLLSGRHLQSSFGHSISSRPQCKRATFILLIAGRVGSLS